MFLTSHQLAALLERCPPDSGVYFTSETEGATAEEAAVPAEITATHWVGGLDQRGDQSTLSPLGLGEVREGQLIIEPTGEVTQRQAV